LEPGRQLALDGQSAHYLLRVLRVNVEQPVVLFNGDGHDYAAEVVRAQKREITLSVLSRLPAAREPEIEITVVQAISRGERMDQTLQKCTELGAASFLPLLSERVEVRLGGDKLEKRLEHWQGVVISACEQSGRARIPQVHRPLKLTDWLTSDRNGLSVVLAPGADTPLARISLPSSVQIAIGPEGGFSSTELGLMVSQDVRAVSLGPRVLRTETAAPAAVTVIQTMAGDFAY
jgi:16S rRNA (uracil1498-N3)-methyltransferase